MKCSLLARYRGGMFVKITKSGPRQYIQLVEAFRDADGTTRHRHIANLGRVDESKGKLDRLIDGLSRVTGRAPPEAPTFERAVEVGGPWVLSALWNRLGLLRCLRGLTRADAKLDLDALTRVMVINRLCDADSKLGVLRGMSKDTGGIARQFSSGQVVDLKTGLTKDINSTPTRS